MHLKLHGGLELPIEAFDPEMGKPYALVVDGCDPVGAIEATHGLISELGIDASHVVTCHHYYPHVPDGELPLKQTLSEIAFGSREASAIVVIPGFGKSALSQSHDCNQTDVVAFLYALRNQLSFVGESICFVPFHTRDTCYPIIPLMRALSVLGFTVLQLVNPGQSKLCLEDFALDEAISLMAIGDAAEKLLNSNGTEG